MCGFAPDCVVAACSTQTWLESAVAAFLPGARQISLGAGLTDPLVRAALNAVVPIDWATIYPQRIPLEPDLSEWEQNLHLAGALLGKEAPRWWPVTQVPPAARSRAAQTVAEAGLTASEYVVCAAAGTANVRIKSWPIESYGETLAWLEKERGVHALLIGHISEREHLETVQASARRHGAEPALWLGQDGEMPIVAGLLDAARFYFGNDTGAAAPGGGARASGGAGLRRRDVAEVSAGGRPVRGRSCNRCRVSAAAGIVISWTRPACGRFPRSRCGKR